MKFGGVRQISHRRCRGGTGPENIKFAKFGDINDSQKCIPRAILAKFPEFVGSSTIDYILNWARCTQWVPKLLCFNFELCFPLATLAANLYVKIEGYSDAKMTLISCIITPSMAGLVLRAPSGGGAKKFNLLFVCP